MPVERSGPRRASPPFDLARAAARYPARTPAKGGPTSQRHSANGRPQPVENMTRFVKRRRRRELRQKEICALRKLGMPDFEMSAFDRSHHRIRSQSGWNGSPTARARRRPQTRASRVLRGNVPNVANKDIGERAKEVREAQRRGCLTNRVGRSRLPVSPTRAAPNWRLRRVSDRRKRRWLGRQRQCCR